MEDFDSFLASLIEASRQQDYDLTHCHFCHELPTDCDCYCITCHKKASGNNNCSCDITSRVIFIGSYGLQKNNVPKQASFNV